jgi:hypothetical protein
MAFLYTILCAFLVDPFQLVSEHSSVHCFISHHWTVNWSDVGYFWSSKIQKLGLEQLVNPQHKKPFIWQA